MILSAAAVAQAAPPNTQTAVTLVVRADSKTGRLVRSVAAPPRAQKRADPQIQLPPSESAPPAFASLVNRAAERYDVDKDLVHSVIRVESNYNPFAVSAKGALGLMQLDASTARKFGVADVFNPAQNVEGGVKYLKYLLDRFAGDHRLALAAYNAGESAVDRYRGVPPFPETRNYVFQVGKTLDQAKETHQGPNATPAAKPGDGHNPIRAYTDATGKVYYKTL